MGSRTTSWSSSTTDRPIAPADHATEAAAGAPHVIVRRREREPGPRTKGAVLAWVHSTLRGEVVGAIDADTLVEPGFLERDDARVGA